MTFMARPADGYPAPQVVGASNAWAPPPWGAAPPPAPAAPPSFVPTEVQVDADFQRIAALPRFVWDTQADLESGRQALTQYLRWNPNPCASGKWKKHGGGYLCSVCKAPYELRPIQAAALRALYDLQGVFGSMAVGSGKTLVTLLAPTLLGSQWPLLIIPSSLLEKTLKDILAISRHWRIHHAFITAAGMNKAEFKRQAIRRACILKYAELSRDAGAMKLMCANPDLAMLDECQYVKNRGAAVTKKIARAVKQWRRQHPTVVGVFSGSIANRSFGECWSPMKWSLGQHGPLPLELKSYLSWCYAMDEKIPEMSRLDPGPLLELTPGAREIARESRRLKGLTGEPEPLDIARVAFAERFASCAGVVSSKDDIPPYGLEITVEQVEAPPIVRQAVDYLRENWATPDGNEFEHALELWMRESRLARGGWSCWDPLPPEEWRAARSAWFKFVRGFLRDSKTLDSPGQVESAVMSGKVRDGGFLEAWNLIKPTFKPHSVWQWLPAGSHVMLERAAAWLKETERAIVWVQTIALGDALSAMTGVPYYHESGRDAEGNHVMQAKGRAICGQGCAIGQNLQFEFTHNYMLEMPPTGWLSEQMFGRTHRNGQTEDTVTFRIPIMTEGDARGLQQVIRDAHYAFDSRKEPQKLVYGTWLGRNPQEMEGLL